MRFPPAPITRWQGISSGTGLAASALAAGLAQTFEWYLREGLDRREVDFAQEDALLAPLR